MNILRIHFVLSAHVYPGLILGLGRIVRHGRFFQADSSDSSDLLHMGVYTGMGVITGEYGILNMFQIFSISGICIKLNNLRYWISTYQIS